jgi:hypothetical protein
VWLCVFIARCGSVSPPSSRLLAVFTFGDSGPALTAHGSFDLTQRKSNSKSDQGCSTFSRSVEYLVVIFVAVEGKKIVTTLLPFFLV